MAFQFSEESRRKLADIKARYPDVEAAVIPALHLGQAQNGWVSREVMDAVAAELGVAPTHVLSTATFYTMFHKKPVGRFHLQVCTNVSCALRGGYRLVDAIRERLHIDVGETTPDQRFTLSEVECLAACGTAPTLQVNDTYHEQLDLAKLHRLLDELEAAP
jgi:NADH-quinone oxidoreductase subunit E